MLAAATSTVAAGSLIVSQPVHADSGSSTCRFVFSGSPVATFRAYNTLLGDTFDISMSTVGGTCPCGGVTSIQYAYYLDATTNDASTGSGWVASSAWNVGGFFANLWPNTGGTFRVYAGVRVTCTGTAGVAVRCRYATSTNITIGAASWSPVNGTLALGSNNGNGGPGVLPACDPPAPLIARPLSGSAMGAALPMQPGPLVIPDEVRRLQAAESSNDLLGNPLQPVVSPDTTVAANVVPAAPTTTMAPATTTTASPAD